MDASITKVLEAVQEEFAPRRPRSSSSRQSRSRQSSAASNDSSSSNSNSNSNGTDMPGASPSSSYEPTFSSRLSASPAAPGFSFDSSMAEQDSYSHLDDGGKDGDGRSNTAFAGNPSELDTPRAERSEPVMMDAGPAVASGAPNSYPTSTITGSSSRFEISNDANARTRLAGFASSRTQPSSSSSSSTSYSANRAKRNSLNSFPADDISYAVGTSQNTSFGTSPSSAGSSAGPSFISLPALSSSNSGASARKTSTSSSNVPTSKLAGSDHIMLTPGVDDIPFTFKTRQSAAGGARPGLSERRNSQQEIFA